MHVESEKLRMKIVADRIVENIDGGGNYAGAQHSLGPVTGIDLTCERLRAL
jgi:hypothetical protein